MPLRLGLPHCWYYIITMETREVYYNALYSLISSLFLLTRKCVIPTMAHASYAARSLHEGYLQPELKIPLGWIANFQLMIDTNTSIALTPSCSATVSMMLTAWLFSRLSAITCTCHSPSFSSMIALPYCCIS